MFNLMVKIQTKRFSFIKLSLAAVKSSQKATSAIDGLGPPAHSASESGGDLVHLSESLRIL